MITHWLRLVWNRRRGNTAIVVEIAICFMVLCGVAALGLHQLDKARVPLGFAYDGLFVVDIGLGSYYSEDDARRAEIHGMVDVLLRTVNATERVVSAAFSGTTPYRNGRSSRSIYFGGEIVDFVVADCTAKLDETLQLEVAEGRWFVPSDLASGEDAVVVTRGLARRFFGDASPIGRTIPNQNEDGIEQPLEVGQRVQRVVGVIENYRRLGEFGARHETLFELFDLDSTHRYLPGSLIVRSEPGAGGRFEEGLLRTLRTSEPSWRFRITSMESMRDRRRVQQLTLPLIGVVVAAFLVLMVGLGLVGVLWQSVARRTAEFGVRRALGSTAGSIRALVLGELLVLATAAVAIGATLFVQIPLLGIVDGPPARVWAGAVALAAFVLYSFVLVCGLYPSWLATRIEPARALQYE